MYKVNNWLIHLDHLLVIDLPKNEEKRIVLSRIILYL